MQQIETKPATEWKPEPLSAFKVGFSAGFLLGALVGFFICIWCLV